MGSSNSGPAREAKWGVTVKGRPPRAAIPSINARSSALTDAARAGGKLSMLVISFIFMSHCFIMIIVIKCNTVMRNGK
jgi:hypothetical protein